MRPNANPKQVTVRLNRTTHNFYLMESYRLKKPKAIVIREALEKYAESEMQRRADLSDQAGLLEESHEP